MLSRLCVLYSFGAKTSPGDRATMDNQAPTGGWNRAMELHDAAASTTARRAAHSRPLVLVRW
jgi:hypothetical protein